MVTSMNEQQDARRGERSPLARPETPASRDR
jgi:hypothetical protein